MNNVNSNFPALITAPFPPYFQKPVRRLIVLVPTDADYTAAAQRVWDLAKTLHSPVQFLGLCEHAAEESSLRRHLITMSAMVQYGDVPSEICIESGSNWLGAVKAALQDGDGIVCLGEQRTGWLQRPLQRILESNLSAPVYVIPGLSAGKRIWPNWLSEVAVCTGSFGIIAGFIVLQIRIVFLPDDWLQTALMILTVLAEAWLIWTWNGLFT